MVQTQGGCGVIFKPTLSREEAENAVGVYKLAVMIPMDQVLWGLRLVGLECLEAWAAAVVALFKN